MTDENDFWIDECFRVQYGKVGLWYSFDKQNTPLITALTKESCISATRFYLKGKQEGFEEPATRHEGVVGGKL